MYKKIITVILCLIITLASLIYLMLVFAVPKLLNNPKVSKEIERLISKKTNANLTLTDLKIQTNYSLLYTITAKKVHLENKAKMDLLDAKDVNIEISLIKHKIKDLNIDYIFINEQELKNIIKNNKNRKTSEYKIKDFPGININTAEIWVDKGEKNKVFITISDIKLKNENNDKTYCYFDAEIISNNLKNTINIGKKGYLLIDDKSLIANNLQIMMGIHSIDVNGKIIDDEKQRDFTLKGKNLPVYDIENSLLYFLKKRKPGKQFLDNFKDFDGEIDIDLQIKNDNIFGECEAKELSAKTVLFNVPVYFKNAVFEFNGKTIQSKEEGELGNEKVTSSFKIEKLLTKEQEVTGEVKSSLTDKFADKYMPELTIKNKIDAKLSYKIKEKKTDISYNINLEPNAEIYFGNGYLGLEEYRRKLNVKTHKEGDILTITEYNYSIQEGNEDKKLVLGNGLFEKVKGHLRLKYLTFKTNGYAPFSATGFLNKYLDSGYFSGNLKYDYIDNKVTGEFQVKNAQYKKFFVREANVRAKTNTVLINAEGEFNNSDFKCEINGVNRFDNNIIINNMNLFLDKYIINKIKKEEGIKQNNFDIKKAAKEINITIKKWNIRLNQIKYKRIDIKNIILSGSLKNNLFNFKICNANFAQGKIEANGLYNFTNNDSIIDFSIENIDSNIVADTVFNLPNQIHGIASAKIHAQTKNKLDDIKAHINFSINDGYLMKLGSTEFIIKKSKKIKRPFKIKLQDIVNIDITRTKALSSNIKGAFDMENYLLKNIFLTSQQKYLSLMIEGEYNILKQDADLRLWGKYNKNAEKGVRILFIPLSWIVNIIFRPEQTKHLYTDKLNKVPPIIAKAQEEKAFRVMVKGNLNNNNLKVELKTIK